VTGIISLDTIAEAPIFPEFSPFSPEQILDPYPILKMAREERPVFYCEDLKFWVVTRYADINRIYGEPLAFSSSEVLSPRLPRPDEITRDYGEREIRLDKWLVMSDPPAHARLKKLMSPAFSPTRVAQMEAWTRAFAHRLVDEIEAAGSADLVKAYAHRIPSAVMGHIVGAHQKDARNFALWVEDIFTLTGAWDIPREERVSAWRGVFAFEDYVSALVAERRIHPANDLTSDFIQAVGDDGEAALTDEEVLANIFNVAAAGADTTGVMIAQLIYLLLSDRERWDRVGADRKLLVNAIDETMRFRAPVRGLMRKTTQEVAFGAVVIPAQSLVFMSLASANHDAAMFREPEVFDLERKNAKLNIGFGSQSHACIGANLARFEARIAVEVLMARLPDIRLKNPDIGVEYKNNLMLPSIKSLCVAW
jgi:cytochrome P450